MEWEEYFANGVNLQNENDSTVVSLRLSSLMGSNMNQFWRYEGSLTTPPCTEKVIWSVFRTPITFSESNIVSFRQNILPKNLRGPQFFYNRTVYRNFVNETLSSIPDHNCCQISRSNSSNSANNLLNRKVFLFLSIENFSSFVFFIGAIVHYVCF